MENAYGIGVKNRYELFYNEDVDPLEILRKNEEEKVKRKTDKTSPKEKSLKNGKSGSLTKKTKDVPLSNSTKAPEATESSNKSRPRPFSERNYKPSRNFEESKDLEEKRNFHNNHETPFSENRDGEFRRGRGGFRGGRLLRGGGRGGYFNPEGRPPRRDFEKGGFRAGDVGYNNNWNDTKSDYTPRRNKEPESTWMEEDNNETSVEKQSDSWGEIPTENIVSCPDKEETSNDKTDDPLTESGELKENVSTEEKEMTLDEWKREQETKRAIPKYNLRKPGEGEDDNQWKKLYILKKKVQGAHDEEDEEDDEDDDEFSRRGRQRQLVDIQINFNDAARRGRGRGRGSHREPPLHRPGGRSYRGKANKSGQPPRVDDWNDFPSLLTA